MDDKLFKEITELIVKNRKKPNRKKPDPNKPKKIITYADIEDLLYKQRTPE